jgi:bifunctional UDP-N-acetylglucosamine pyrophosphorylase/glucosamine-1-phosphate N-acetyltransferase
MPKLSKKITNSLFCCILAAGEGIRMNSNIPKVLHKVYKKPLISYVLEAVKRLNIDNIITVVGYKSKQVEEKVEKDSKVIKQQRLLGTADALKQATNKIKSKKGHTLVLYGDTPLIKPETLAKLIKHHINSKASCTLLTSIVKNPYGYGRVLRNNNNKIKKIIEEKEASLYEKVIEEVNTGIYCFSNEVFKYLDKIKSDNTKKEYYLTDIVEVLSKEGKRIESLQADDSEETIGINTRKDLAKANNVLRERIQEEIILKGVTIVDPLTTHIDKDVEIGKDTVIEPFVRIENDVKIGRNCQIGPFARLRPKTVIKDKVKLGNFVEVVRSTIGSGTKINHHTYIGDSQIDKNVNIGAGTITANYDGQKKNKTVIKEGAFIGSGSILVAPVTIGKNAVTGANCVVNKGRIKDGDVVAGVPAKVLRKRKKSKEKK